MKLLPGGLKKGKAAKGIMNYFFSFKDLTGYEKKIMKTLSDEDLVSNLIQGVKL